MSTGDALHLGAGLVLLAVAWLGPRRVARARPARPAILLLDASPFLLGAGLLVLATGRPLFAGVVALALAAGFALADHTMRRTLREPAVFSEAVELPQVFTHPHLYLPFAGPGLVLGGAAASAALGLALLLVEPPLWEPRPLTAFAVTAALAASAWLAGREPLLGRAAAMLRRLARPSAEPFEDAASLGPFAMLIVHAVIARAERGARRQALAPPPLRRTGAGRTGPRGPIILVQCESFFDARRLSPLIPPGLLAGFDACRATGTLSGRLAVPGWGANTMRAEFAVLSGVPDRDLGYDRFNPYYALARVPLESHVWRLRRAGYRTVCLHPFDRRFFRRDLVMPALGFERFLGRETLGGSRTPPYYPDPALAEDILRMVEQDGDDAFVFAITMGNHGPWLDPGAGRPLDPAVAGLFDPAGVDGGRELSRYLDGLRRSDEMLQILLHGLRHRGGPAVLAFYGDHLPSLPRAFAHFDFDETSSDYVIWGGAGGPAHRDIAAHELGGLVLGTAQPPTTADTDACLARPEPASFSR